MGPKNRNKNYLKQYQNTLEELLQINSDQHREEDDNADVEVENEWDKIKQSLVSATSRTTGEKNIGKNAECFHTECVCALKRKNEARTIMLQHGAGSSCEVCNDYRKKANKICRTKTREIITKINRHNRGT
jgi:hypothetical protein